MNYSNKFKMMMVAIIALYGYEGFASAGKAGKIAATQAARMAFQAGKSSMNLSPNVIQAAKQSQSRLYSQHTPKIAASALMKQQVAEGKQNTDSLDVAKWLAVGGLAVAADIVHDKMNTIDFEDIDKEKIPNFKECVDYLKYRLKDIKFADDLDFEMIIFLYQPDTYDFLCLLTNTLIHENQSRLMSMHDVQEFSYDVMMSKSHANIGFFDKIFDSMNNYLYDSKTETAHHEAGHALISALYLCNQKLLVRVAVDKSKADEGYTFQLQLTDRNLFNMQNTLIQLFAGPVAERIYLKGDSFKVNDTFSDIITFGGVGDMQHAFPIIKKMAEQQLLLEDIKLKLQGKKKLFDFEKDADYYRRFTVKQNEIMKDAYLKTIELLKMHKKEHKEIVQALCEKGTISGEEVYKIVGVNPRLLGFQDDRQLAPVEEYLEYR